MVAAGDPAVAPIGPEDDRLEQGVGLRGGGILEAKVELKVHCYLPHPWPLSRTRERGIIDG